jgi:hypothetical protein
MTPLAASSTQAFPISDSCSIEAEVTFHQKNSSSLDYVNGSLESDRYELQFRRDFFDRIYFRCKITSLTLNFTCSIFHGTEISLYDKVAKIVLASQKIFLYATIKEPDIPSLIVKRNFLPRKGSTFLEDLTITYTT